MRNQQMKEVKTAMKSFPAITAVSPMTTCVPSSRRRVDGVEVDERAVKL